MTEPVTGLEEWAGGQTQPHVPVNALLRALAIMAQRVAADILTAVPGAPVDGDCYLVGASGTSGALVGHEDQILYYDGGPKFLTPKAGWLIFIADDGGFLKYSGSGWQNYSPLWIPPDTETTTNRDATPDNAGRYTTFTNASAKTYTFDDTGFGSGETYVEGSEFQGRNDGAGDLTLVAAGGITLKAPTGGTLVIPQDGTFTVKVTDDPTVLHVIGVTNPV